MRRSSRLRARASLVAVLGCVPLAESRAAGGHFAVDDAALLEPGQCQVETWVERGSAKQTLVHAGPVCRVGAVELGVNVDHLRSSGEPSETVFGPQLKWARALDARASVGVVALAGWRGRDARYAAAALYVPVTVRFAEGVWLHVNGGRDWVADASPSWRSGVALEWQAAPAWFMTGEALRQTGDTIARVGVRWQPSEAFSVDLSHARGVASTPGSSWALGANWTFSPGRR